MLKNSALSFKSFLSSQGKNILFTSLFYSLWLAKEIALAQNFDLHSFTDRMIGCATMEAVDVGSRVFLFYKCMCILFCAFLTFSAIGYFIFRINVSLLTCNETKIINYVSLSAILLVFIKCFGYKTSDTMEMVYFLHKIMVVGILLKAVFPKIHLTIYNYTFAILLSVSVYFLISDCAFLFNIFVFPDFFLTTFLTCCLVIVALNIMLRREATINQLRIDRLVYCIFPIVFLPLLSILKDEIFLIFKVHQIHAGHLAKTYFVLLAVLLGFVALRINLYKKGRRVSQKKLISRLYFPGFIFSIITYVKYIHQINFSSESFEAANKFLPIMEYNLFGVIPTLEKFNSHLLSDYFFSGIYTFFNGLGGYEMTLYDFFDFSISYVLYYYLVLYISRNPFIALFCVLIFPFYVYMLPPQYSFGVFAIFGLQKLISQKPSLKSYFIFFAVVAGLILWRIDLGYTCLIVMSSLLSYYHIRSKKFKISPVLFLKGAACVAGLFVAIIGVLSLHRDLNLFKKLQYALNYLTSAQAYGHITLGWEEQMTFKMHYYVFPAFVGILVILLLLKYKALNVSRGQRLSYLSLLFTCLFYVINFNRGLVRHGLIELTDHFVSTYIYIIIPGAFLVFFKDRTQTFKYLGFFSITTFLLINYKVPNLAGSKSFFEEALTKVQEKNPSDLSKIESRVIYDSLYKNKNDSLFIKFIKKNTKPNETFIDFSNNPMLYFYTKKITPSYFYQNPLSSHNDFLQERFITDLKGYNTPYLLFSTAKFPYTGSVDGVPNILRHYRMAEYFYNNYEPYISLGNLLLWKSKTAKYENKKDTIYRYRRNGARYQKDSSLRAELNFKLGKKYVVRVISTQQSNLLIKTVFSKDSLYESPEKINSSLSYCELLNKGNRCRFEVNSLSSAITELEIIECDYIPDFYSEGFPAYEFSKLPYIWGKYDKNVLKEPVLFEKSSFVQLQKNQKYTFKIPQLINKTSGNTILIRCKNKSQSIQSVRLSFGSDKEKERTNIAFSVIVSDKEENYAIRISSIYRWQNQNVNEISLLTDSEVIDVSKIKITKGL